MTTAKQITLYSALSAGVPFAEASDLVLLPEIPSSTPMRMLHPAYIEKSFVTKTFTNTKHSVAAGTGRLEGLGTMHALSGTSDNTHNRTMYRTPDIGLAQSVAATAIASQLGIPLSAEGLLTPERYGLDYVLDKMPTGHGGNTWQALGVRWRGDFPLSPVLLGLALASAISRYTAGQPIFEAYVAPPQDGVTSALLIYRGWPVYPGSTQGVTAIDSKHLIETLGLLVTKPGPMTCALLRAASQVPHFLNDMGCASYAFHHLSDYIQQGMLGEYLRNKAIAGRGGMPTLLLQEPYNNV